MKTILQANSIPPHTVVATRAYNIYESEGRPVGRELEHWLRAEASVRAEYLARQLGYARPAAKIRIASGIRRKQVAALPVTGFGLVVFDMPSEYRGAPGQ